MGMYDTICGDQVKCFYKYFEVNGELWSTSGSLRFFNIGDKVPYRTGWYNYTPNFNIINIWDDSSTGDLSDTNILTGIRNGRVKFVKPLVRADIEDWLNVQRCISYNGDWLRITSQTGALDYARAVKEYELKRTDYLMNNMPFRIKSNNLLFGIAVAENDEKVRRLAELEAMEDEKNKEFAEFDIFDKNLRTALIDPFEKGVKPNSVLMKEEKGAIRNIKRQKKKREQH